MSKGIKRRKHRYIGLWLTLSLASIAALSLPGTASAEVMSDHCVDINDTRAKGDGATGLDCLAPPEQWENGFSNPLPHGAAGSAADFSLFFHEPANTTSSDLVKDLNAYLAPGTSFDPTVKPQCTEAEINDYLANWLDHDPDNVDGDYPCEDPDTKIGRAEAQSIIAIGSGITATSYGRILNGVPDSGSLAKFHIVMKTHDALPGVHGKPVVITASVVEENGVPIIKVVDLPEKATVKFPDLPEEEVNIRRTPYIYLHLQGKTTAPGFTRLPNLPNSCDAPQQVRVKYNNRSHPSPDPEDWEQSDPFWPDADKFNVTDCGGQPNERPVIVSGGWSQDAVNTFQPWGITLNAKVTDNDGSVDRVKAYFESGYITDLTDPDGDGIYTWSVDGIPAENYGLLAAGFSILAYDDEQGYTSRAWPFLDVPESSGETTSGPGFISVGKAFQPGGPHIYSASFGESTITQNQGGRVYLTACASGDTRSVELYYNGEGTGALLTDDNQDCGAGGKRFSLDLDLPTPQYYVPAYQYLFELRAANASGGKSSLWPYVTLYHSGKQSVPSTEEVQGSLRDLSGDLGANLSGLKVKKQKPVKLLDLIREGAGASNLNQKTRAAHSKTTTTSA